MLSDGRRRFSERRKGLGERRIARWKGCFSRRWGTRKSSIRNRSRKGFHVWSCGGGGRRFRRGVWRRSKVGDGFGSRSSRRGFGRGSVGGGCWFRRGWTERTLLGRIAKLTAESCEGRGGIIRVAECDLVFRKDWRFVALADQFAVDKSAVGGEVIAVELPLVVARGEQGFGGACFEHQLAVLRGDFRVGNDGLAVGRSADVVDQIGDLEGVVGVQ